MTTLRIIAITVLTLWTQVTATTDEQVVTLPHGGKLRGFTAPMASTMIDVYLGKSWIKPY